MSTYLVAFVISDFEFNESDLRQNNVTFRIWARKNALDQTDYARGIGARILQYFEHYFDVDFPLPKQVRIIYLRQEPLNFWTIRLAIFSILVQSNWANYFILCRLCSDL